jgi:hypothetical protein
MFTTFDAPSGEACLARRDISNTPLQSLALLNDGVFVEAAQALGKQLAGERAPLDSTIDLLVRRCMSRPPSNAELTLLTAFHNAQLDRLRQGELAASSIAGAIDGETPAETINRAAWTLTARAVMNLDETITKE